MRMHLTSITEHSDWLDIANLTFLSKWKLHRKLVEFGKQNLEIWMFVPCKFVDGIWVVLEEPTTDGFDLNDMYDWNLYDEDCQEYQEAKERCLFEEFFVSEGKDTQPTDVKSITNGTLHVFWFNNIDKWYLSRGLSAIEDLIKYNLILTATAQKMIGL